MPSSNLHIAVGVIFNDTGDKVLLAKRPDNVQQGGLWEFPGGKLHPGEAVEQGLRRELFEELGLVVDRTHRLIVIDHDYPENTVTLDVWLVDQWHGDVSGKEGQLIEWVTLDDLSKKEFPAANRGIIAAVRLPPIYLITPEPEKYDKYFSEKLISYMNSGIKLIQFRNNNISPIQIRTIVPALVTLCHEYDCKLMFNGHPEQALELGADGVHLSSARLMELNIRPLNKEYYVGASCHNTREIEHANKIGVDFAVLGPVKHTSSHVGVEPIGWQKYSELVRRSAIPVYALGGMRISDLELCKQYGGQGLAMISGIWGTDDSGSMISKIMKAGN